MTGTIATGAIASNAVPVAPVVVNEMDDMEKRMAALNAI